MINTCKGMGFKVSEIVNFKRLYLVGGRMMVVKAVNLTPHKVNLVLEDKSFSVEPSGILVRLSTQMEQVGEIELGNDIKVPIEKVEYGEPIFIENGKTIPLAEVNKILRNRLGINERDTLVVIVPQLLAARATEIAKLLSPAIVVAPNTSKAIRDNEGRIQGVPSLLLLTP